MLGYFQAQKSINILAASHRHLISELLQHKQQLTQ